MLRLVVNKPSPRSPAGDGEVLVYMTDNEIKLFTWLRPDVEVELMPHDWVRRDNGGWYFEKVSDED